MHGNDKRVQNSNRKLKRNRSLGRIILPYGNTAWTGFNTPGMRSTEDSVNTATNFRALYKTERPSVSQEESAQCTECRVTMQPKNSHVLRYKN